MPEESGNSAPKPERNDESCTDFLYVRVAEDSSRVQKFVAVSDVAVFVEIFAEQSYTAFPASRASTANRGISNSPPRSSVILRI